MIIAENMEKPMQNIDAVNKKQNIQSSKMETIIENEIYYVKNRYIEMQSTCKKIFDNAKLYDKYHKVMKYMLSNPLLLASFIIITATLIVPILSFTIFAIVNVAIIFITFIIIEVALLMIGMTVLCCIMLFIIKILVLTGLFFILSFYVTYTFFLLIKKKLKCK